MGGRTVNCGYGPIYIVHLLANCRAQNCAFDNSTVISRQALPEGIITSALSCHGMRHRMHNTAELIQVTWSKQEVKRTKERRTLVLNQLSEQSEQAEQRMKKETLNSILAH